MTGVKLEKISDIVSEKYLFIEKGLNGGISYIAKRYAKASKKCMTEYDSKKPSKLITYLDMNNLYDWAMSEYLPSEKFKWLKNIDWFDVNSVSEKSPIGYILEVDLEYSDDLHVLHNDYPTAPEKLAIPYDMLSDFCKKVADKYEMKVGYVKKLIPNLGSKTNYVVHDSDLPLYLSLGMKMTKIHRMLKFKQSDWMKKYLGFNTEKTKNVANNFDKDFFKIMINSVCGKTMENLREKNQCETSDQRKRFLKIYQ